MAAMLVVSNAEPVSAHTFFRGFNLKSDMFQKSLDNKEVIMICYSCQIIQPVVQIGCFGFVNKQSPFHQAKKFFRPIFYIKKEETARQQFYLCKILKLTKK
jgi:hypothetical protein